MNLGIVSDCLSDDFYESAHMAKEAGFAFMELRGLHGTKARLLDEDGAEEVRSVLERTGMSLLAFNAAAPRRPLYSPELEEQVRGVERSAALAKSLGAKLLILYSIRRPVENKRGDYRAAVRHIRSCADYAEEAGLTACIENEKGFYCDLPDNILRMQTAADTTNLRICLNIKSYFEAGAKEMSFFAQTAAEHLGYVRLRDPARRPDMDWMGCLRTLHLLHPELPVVCDCVGREENLRLMRELRERFGG